VEAITLKNKLKQKPQVMLKNAWEMLSKGVWADSADIFYTHYLNSEHKSEAALGLGRIATRTGKWQLALQWLNIAIKEARISQDDQQLAKSHGALGELFLRTGLSQQALLNMQIAYELFPAGHFSRQRQYSYLAMPLTRLKEEDVAEDYYMRAFLLALEENNTEQAGHAIIRRAAMCLHNNNHAFNESKALIEKFNLLSPGVIQGYYSSLCYYQQWTKAIKSGNSVDESKPELTKLIKARDQFPKWSVEHIVLSALDKTLFEENEIYSIKYLPEDLTLLPSLQYLNLPKDLEVGLIETPQALRESLMNWFI